MMQPVSVSLGRTSVTGILDEIARQHGRTAWLVRYQDVTGGPKRMTVEFLGFDGWVVAATARR